MNGSAQFDVVGPLHWIRPAIVAAFELVRAQLVSPPGAESDAVENKRAGEQLHQVAGALELIDMPAAARITRELEKLVALLPDAGERGESFIAVGERGLAAIAQEIEDVTRGQSHRGTMLYPIFEQLCAATQTPQTGIAELFFPQLEVSVPDRADIENIDASELSPRIRAQRRLFQQGLIAWVQGKKQGLDIMAGAVDEVERVQGRGQARVIWWLAGGLMDCLRAEAVPLDTSVKKLFSRLDRQFERLADGHTQVAQQLLRDILWVIAEADVPIDRVKEIQQCFALDLYVTSPATEPEVMRRIAVADARDVLQRYAAGASASGLRDQLTRLSTEVSGTASEPVNEMLKTLALAGSALPDQARDAPALTRELTLALDVTQALFRRTGALNNELTVAAIFASRSLSEAIAGARAQVQTPPLASANESDDDLTDGAILLAVAREMRVNLGQIETVLDEYFRDPTKRDHLPETLQRLSQLYGALTVTDMISAAEVVGKSRDLVEAFAQQGFVPDQRKFELVAAGLSAVSLILNEHMEETSGFRSLLHTVSLRFERLGVRLSESAPNMPQQSVEKQVRTEIDWSQQILEVWTQNPDDPSLKSSLQASIEDIRADAHMLGDDALEQKASRTLSILNVSATARASDLVNAMGALAAVDQSVEVTPAVVQADDLGAEDEDREMLEVFLEEALEVLGSLAQAVRSLHGSNSTGDALATIRRGFHTLKGSSRMVGLTEFGDVAWIAEQSMNHWLESGAPASPALIEFIDVAQRSFLGWVEQYSAGGRPQIDAAPIVDATSRLTSDNAIGPDAEEDKAQLEITLTMMREPNALVVVPIEDTAIPLSDAGSPVAANAGFSLRAIFMEEAGQLLGILRAEAWAWGQQSDIAPSYEFMRGAHTLAGIARIVKQFSIAELAAALEQLILVMMEKPGVLKDQTRQAIEASVTLLEEQFAALARSENLADPIGLRGELNDLAEAIRIRIVESAELTHSGVAQTTPMMIVEASPIVTTMPDAHDAEPIPIAPESTPGPPSPEEEISVLAFSEVTQTASETGVAPLDLAAPVENGQDQADRSEDYIDLPSPGVAPHIEPAHEVTRSESEQIDVLATDYEPEGGVSAVAGAVDLLTDQSLFLIGRDGIDDNAVSDVDPVSHADTGGSDDIGAKVPVAEVTETRDNTAEQQPSASTAADRRWLQDDLDPDLLPVFVEEAESLLPSIGENFRIWRARPENKQGIPSLARLLHTLKGSARMVGALRLGELVHGLEAEVMEVAEAVEIRASSFDLWEAKVDRMIDELERMRANDHVRDVLEHTQTLAPTLERVATLRMLAVLDMTLEKTQKMSALKDDLLPEATVTAAQSLEAGVITAPMDEVAIVAEAPAPSSAMAAEPHAAESIAERALIRVASSTLDKLVNQAGEASINQSRVESEFRILRAALSDLTGNAVKLRNQLREMEIQAEAQMQSQTQLHQMSQGNEVFDSLEFDRFSRVQELTRMLAETVNDIVTIQQSAMRGLDTSAAALSTQGHMMFDLQESLMRVRMLAFSSVANRFHRIVRVTARELEKKARLEIQGEDVELDRSVLESVIAPIEHLLRNAVGHGVETIADRQRLDKPIEALIQIVIRQLGNDIVVTLSDDGSGLDLQRVKSKAMQGGLIAESDEFSPDRLAELIFLPGFTTAQEVTEISGRGVGLDVVKSEITALGGRVEVATESGRGTTFTIYLPLTLASTDVLVVRAGAHKYAVPVLLVQLAQRFNADAMAVIRSVRQLSWSGEMYQYFDLAALLGHQAGIDQESRFTHVLLLRSGGSRVAIRVDELQTTRRVVVKGIGSQLARVSGITGATLMADGEIVLIIDPVTLTRRVLEHPVSQVEPVADAMAMTPEASSRAAARPTIMVVDDSITIRKITERVLSRHGYQVILAKDGVDALEKLRDVLPDVMLVDIEMPRMDGFDLTRYVRTDGRTASIPIIMITSRTAAKHREHALELGVNEYLGKPYTEEILLKLVEELIQSNSCEPVGPGGNAAGAVQFADAHGSMPGEHIETHTIN